MTRTAEAGPVAEETQGRLSALRQRLFAAPYSQVHYVIESRGWSIDWDGRYITRAVARQTGVSCRVVRSARGIGRQVVHFGSRHLYFAGGDRQVGRSSRVVVTWFHGSAEDPHPENQRMIRHLPECLPVVKRLVTSSQLVRERLLGWGVPEALIACIPLGVDLARFRPAGSGARENLRERLGIPKDAVCVGSFQKDGQGWREGLIPKLIKGPDILVKTAGRLAKRLKLFVLLLGPSRGYVKQGLTRLGVPFHHEFIQDYTRIASWYHALDAYAVTSRDEGGPKSILEAMACGIPVVSTRVGMAPEVIRDRENGRLVEVEDIAGLTEALADVAERPAVHAQYVERGLKTVQAYDWERVGRQYYEQVYRPLLTRE